MLYYSVCLVHRIVNQKHTIAPTFEQTWVLLLAESEAEARQKATEAGVAKAEIFFNKAGDEIHWQFEGHQYLKQIDIAENGAEIFSLLREPENETLFLTNIASTQKQTSHPFPFISAN